MSSTKLFISYSWSNTTHEEYVIALATELMESGVEVILDKWDLKEGHDAVAFMEKMVTDEDIKKVAIISDKTYAEKADGRDGGVGTETQIISKEIYENQLQDKFVAVVVQKDDDEKPYLPTYYKSRIYIDLSDITTYGENFEKLLRWIFDKPLYVKPELGKTPSFLDDEERISLGTTSKFKRAANAIKNDKAYSSGTLDEYLSTFSSNLESFRITEIKDEFDDAVISNIEKFIPHRNEFIQLIITISQYSPSIENTQKLHRFFESLIPYLNHPENVTSYHSSDFDNFRFIVHELFLYTIAVLIKFECFESAAYLLNQRYYIPRNAMYGRDVMKNFTVFLEYMESLKRRNQRLELRRLSLRADLLKDRCTGIGIAFLQLMQTDFVLFLHAEIDSGDSYGRWNPETLLYLRDSNPPFEIFARSESKKYFDKVKTLLLIQEPNQLDILLQEYRENKRQLPRWEFNSFSPSSLLGYKKLATRP